MVKTSSGSFFCSLLPSTFDPVLLSIAGVNGFQFVVFEPRVAHNSDEIQLKASSLQKDMLGELVCLSVSLVFIPLEAFFLPTLLYCT